MCLIKENESLFTVLIRVGFDLFDSLDRASETSVGVRYEY